MIPFPPFASIYYSKNAFYKIPPKNHNICSNSSRYITPQKKTELVNQDYSRQSNPNTQYFDIFGIRLYFDDILILCLLFFLYQEEVNDQFLFMALLLLLLS